MVLNFVELFLQLLFYFRVTLSVAFILEFSLSLISLTRHFCANFILKYLEYWRENFEISLSLISLTRHFVPILF